MFLKLIPLLFATIALTYGKHVISIKFNRTDADNAPIKLCDVEPDHKEYAKVARYIVHKAEWTSLGTISTMEHIKGYPTVNVVSVADSVRGEKSTGDIYFYVLKVDPLFADLKHENKITALFSDEQSLGCSKRGLDPMEPTCSRIMITGHVAQLPSDSSEFKKANEAFHSRHPSVTHWLNVHNAILCKIEILQVEVLDSYGGPHFVSNDEYYNANYDHEN